MFDIRFDTILARGDIQALTRKLSSKNVNKATASAMNRSVSSGRTKASAIIRAEYRIKKRDLDKNMGTSKAGAKHLKATLYAHGSPLALGNFGFTKVKKGVKVRVKGKATLIPGAFVATMKSGHKGVFARGRYTSTGFEFRKKRVSKKGNDLPITRLNTLSQGAMLRQPKVIKPVMRRVNDMLEKRIKHELYRLINGYGV